MIVRLCKIALQRLPDAGGTALIEALREREHTPVVKDCLDRCGVCEKGTLVAAVDGMPVGAIDAAALLEQVDTLAADEM